MATSARNEVYAWLADTQHFDAQQRLAVHRVFGRPADRREIEWNGPPGADCFPRPVDCAGDSCRYFGRGAQSVDFQFRAELFNIVDFGLPSNTITGSEFGEISRTATNSRQIQVSLKLMF
ncbi:MAG TPA: hypothetical protein VHZ07_26460 [Bryobacteraceae bacterium]|nr:hypothetical protein [Bryobacteraceae bacterium]